MDTIPVTAAGGVLYKMNGQDPEVLLIFRRGIWDLPKGKLEVEESIRECARREVSEEVGSALPEVLHKLGTTYHEYEEQGENFGKTTHWYAMQLGSEFGGDFTPEQEEDITEVAWFPLEEAKETVGFENLRMVLIKLEQWLQ
ncbi:NUDIX hydrolase [Halalkalibaculum sp. DA3122]|uniref:NUDIX hydrolase n=1 Tax=Halalkalibaculum sp. DA3122 TaxID=3373607 RepID=UPI003754460A